MGRLLRPGSCALAGALRRRAAATGGRIVATLAKILAQNGGGRGLISICTAGGMGVAAIMEGVSPTQHTVH